MSYSTRCSALLVAHRRLGAPTTSGLCPVRGAAVSPISSLLVFSSRHLPKMRPHSHTAETSQSGQPLQHLADYLIRLRLLSPHQETIHDYYDHLRIILGIEGRFYLALLAADEEISSTLIHPVASRGRAESHILEERLRKWCK